MGIVTIAGHIILVIFRLSRKVADLLNEGWFLIQKQCGQSKQRTPTSAHVSYPHTYYQVCSKYYYIYLRAYEELGREPS